MHRFGIHDATGFDLDLVGYIDDDWVGDATYHKSTLGYLFSNGFGPIFWSSKKQTTNYCINSHRGRVSRSFQCSY